MMQQQNLNINVKENKKYLYDQRVINIKERERLKKEREEKKKENKGKHSKGFGGYWNLEQY